MSRKKQSRIIMIWYFKVLKQYADFNGRARRKEYWMFALFNSIFAWGAMILDNIFGIAIEGWGYGPLYILYMLPMIIPGIAVGERRMHDVGKSGWFLLIPIYNLILAFTGGEKGTNQYGSDPKEVSV